MSAFEVELDDVRVVVFGWPRRRRVRGFERALRVLHRGVERERAVRVDARHRVDVDELPGPRGADVGRGGRGAQLAHVCGRGRRDAELHVALCARFMEIGKRDIWTAE